MNRLNHVMKNGNIMTAALLVSALGACGGSSKVETAKQVEEQPAPEQANSGVQEATGDLRDALISLQKVHFALNSAELTQESRDGLSEAAPKLIKHAVELHVDGHTDTRGTEEYNAALGEKRANVVVDYLKTLGVDGGKLHAHSWGEEKLAAMGEGSEEHAANRRVEFRMMQGKVQLVLGEGTMLDDQGNPIQ